MEKIVTHPLFIKAKKVMDSCKTEEQKITAENFKDLCIKGMYKEYCKKTPNLWARFHYSMDINNYFNGI